jgi:hypothetical protein
MLMVSLPDTRASLAEMVADPAATPVTRPPVTVATDVAELVQVAPEVRSFWVPTE